MNERQMITVLIGIFAVLLMVLAWASLYPQQEWNQVASGVAGASVFVAFAAIIVGFIWTVVNRR